MLLHLLNIAPDLGGRLLSNIVSRVRWWRLCYIALRCCVYIIKWHRDTLWWQPVVTVYIYIVCRASHVVYVGRLRKFMCDKHHYVSGLAKQITDRWYTLTRHSYNKYCSFVSSFGMYGVPVGCLPYCHIYSVLNSV